jgi:hypothetical protein
MMSAWLWHYRVLVARYARTGSSFTYDAAAQTITRVVRADEFVPWANYYRVETR